VVVGVTGATGAIYARRLLEFILPQTPVVHLTMSHRGAQVLNFELGIDVSLKRFDAMPLLGYRPDNLQFWHPADLNAPFASGSAAADAMVIVPCSMSKVGVIVHGYSEDLIARAADVALKERKDLIVVPRESPLNLVHLKNLLAVAEAGALVLPAMPSFYQMPKTLEDLVDTVVYRIVDHLGLDVPDSARWAGERAERAANGPA
jgi:4-hydroxy-3-polyprenylbenzoate decarboxylase